MKLLPEFDEGFDAIMNNKDNIIRHITAQMTFFPLCCSTGVLKNVTACTVTKYDKTNLTTKVKEDGVNIARIKNANFIYEIMVECLKSQRPVFFPISFARWNSLSKILAKITKGHDDGPDNGYGGFKAAQIVMFDRVLEDKRNPKFKFSTYNTTFSVDQLMDWLQEQDGRMGEVLISTPSPGGHGARVRGCIYTPNEEALTEYHNIRLKIVKDHVLEFLSWQPAGKVQKAMKKAVDSIATKW